MIRRIGFWAIGLLAAASLGLAAVAIVLVRMDLRPRIESLASARLGRATTIDTLAIGWGSQLTLEATGLRISNPAWGSTRDMVAIGHLHAQIALWPLLRGALRLNHVVVDRPEIVLERDTDGTGNWVFHGGDFHGHGARPINAASPTEPPVAFVSDLQLGDGDLTFRTTQHHLLRVHIARAVLGAENDSAPVRLHAEGSYNDLKLTADITLASFAALRQAPRPVPTEITVAARRSTIRFKGTMTDPIGFDGILGDIELAAETSEVETGAFETKPALNLALGLKGRLEKPAEPGQGDHWRLTGLNGVIDQSAVAGTIRLDEGKRGQPDHFDIDLDFAALDIQHLASQFSGPPQPGPVKSPSLSVAAHPGETYAIRIGAKEAVYGRYKFSMLGLQARVEPARISLDKLSFGFADGRVELSGTNETAASGGHLRLNAALSQASSARLIAMAGANTAMLAGKLDAQATLEMTGATAQEALAASRGQAALAMTGGQISRELLQLASSDLRLLLRKGQGAASVTCFLAVADMRNGVASVAPLRLKTREGNLFGGGQVDLRHDALDLYVQSEGKSTNFWALDIPVRITGSFTSPQVQPSTGSKTEALRARGGENLRILPPALRQAIAGKAC